KKLKNNDKKYFYKFKKAILSKDRLKIQKQLKKTTDDIIKISEKENKGKDNVTTYAIKPGFAAVVAWSYVGATHIAAAALVTFAAVGNFAVITNKFKVKKSVAYKDEVSELSQEEYINFIAERL
ncbi:TPA: hypothetical protein ACU2IW_002641, partial [Staphylococcus aureus]|nr:hypothetical protein [Staphylococcus aureus]HCW3607132.1 hypothetical protein [Staphylococcus aureus]